MSYGGRVMLNRKYNITTDSELLKIGPRIRLLLKLNRMTVQDFSDEVGVSEQAAYRWFNGDNIPDIARLIDISKLFMVSLDYLLVDGPVDEKSYEKALGRE